jgi:hypothetical protein
VDPGSGIDATDKKTVKITNHQNLPEPLVNAITWSDRDREGCDFTITELLRPPRIAQLERQHWDDITEDASDRLWALMGSAGHEVLRRSAPDGIVEERAIVEVGGFKVGGQLDYVKGSENLWDYKLTSVWVAKDGAKQEWVEQLNCYRFLAHAYGVEIKSLKIVCIYRDWSKREATRDTSYPQTQVQVFDLPIWSLEDTEAFIKTRIAMHEAAKIALPECTSEEMWEKPAKWAVKKKGNVRALKLHDSEAAAKAHVAAVGNGLEVEFRPGERPRCESYCRVMPFCDQYKAWKGE